MRFLLLLAGCAARHDGPIGLRSEGGVGVYANDDGLTVVSPWADARQAVSDHVAVGVGWKADVISAATVDVISSATQPFTETRHEGSVRVTGDFGDTRFATSAIASGESDTVTGTFAGSAERDLLDHTLTLGLAYSAGFYKIGTVHEAMARWQGRQVHQIDATATRVLDKNTVASASYTFQYQGGALASPYLAVPLLPADQALWDRQHVEFVGERLPETRLRHSLDLRARHAFGDSVFLWAGWQGYLDSWSMRADTGDAGVGVSLPVGVIVELTERFRWQSSTSFYRAAHTVNRDFMARDRRLGEMFTESGGLALRFDRLPVETLVGAELQWTRYADFRAFDGDEFVPFPDTLAIVAQAGFAADF